MVGSNETMELRRSPPMDLVFVLKWVKSVTGCLLYKFHLSDLIIGDSISFEEIDQAISCFN